MAEQTPGIAVSYVRHQGTTETRKFEPLPSDHDLVGTSCFGCGKDFKPGDVTTMVAVGPGDDLEQRKKAQRGFYNSVALVIHWACATGTDA